MLNSAVSRPGGKGEVVLDASGRKAGGVGDFIQSAPIEDGSRVYRTSALGVGGGRPDRLAPTDTCARVRATHLRSLKRSHSWLTVGEVSPMGRRLGLCCYMSRTKIINQLCLRGAGRECAGVDIGGWDRLQAGR
jgi:hypothetical protein